MLVGPKAGVDHTIVSFPVLPLIRCRCSANLRSPGPLTLPSNDSGGNLILGSRLTFATSAQLSTRPLFDSSTNYPEQATALRSTFEAVVHHLSCVAGREDFARRDFETSADLSRDATDLAVYIGQECVLIVSTWRLAQKHPWTISDNLVA